MTLLCDFPFYQEQFGGSLSEGDFGRFAPKAQAFLSFATGGKSQAVLPAPESVKLAMCAVTDELARQARSEGIKSEKAGEYEVSYQEQEGRRNLYGAAALYLENDLLFRGWAIAD